MAIRQYIGARYVVKFYENSLDPSSAEWESGVNFERLTIVTYQNSSYVSKKDVPDNVGNPADNPEYWVCTGYYNGQISQLQTDLQALEDKVNPFIDRHFLCVTDSYGQTPSTTTSWVERFAEVVGSDNVSKAYKGGYGFAPDGYSAPFLNLITPGLVDTGIPSDFDTDKVTDIIVIGGFNDRKTAVNDILNAIDQFCTYARLTYANLKNIYIGAAGWSMNSEHIEDLNHGMYITAYKRCGMYGAKYLAGMENIMHDFALFVEDDPSYNVHVLSHNYVHPNINGSKYIAEFLVSALNGAADVHYPQQVFTFTAASNMKINSGSSFGIVEELTGNICKLEIGVLNIKHQDNSAFIFDSAQTEIELGTIDSGYFNADTHYGIIPATIFIAGGTLSTNTPMGAHFEIKEGKLYLAICLTDTDFSPNPPEPTAIYSYPTSAFLSVV